MRIATRLFIAMALIAPMGVAAVQHSASAAVPKLKCKTTTGTSSIAPPFLAAATSKAAWKAEEKLLPADQGENDPVITSSGTFGACKTTPPPSTISSGTFTSSVTTTDPTSCNDLLSLNGEVAGTEEAGSNFTGTLSVTWSNGDAETFSLVLTANTNSSTWVDITGTGTGEDVGQTLKGTVAFAPVAGGGTCGVGSNLTALSFSQAVGVGAIPFSVAPYDAP